jgi:hypothetical protein
MEPKDFSSGKSRDPFLDEIRSIKEAVSAEFGHDVLELCRALRKEQHASGRRLIRRKPAPTGRGPSGRPST